jgi:hypothetical protein
MNNFEKTLGTLTGKKSINEGVQFKVGDSASGTGYETDKNGNSMAAAQEKSSEIQIKDKMVKVKGKVVKDRVQGEASMMLIQSGNKFYALSKDGASKMSLPGSAFSK